MTHLAVAFASLAGKVVKFSLRPLAPHGTRVALFREVLHRSSNYFALSALIGCFTWLYCTL